MVTWVLQRVDELYQWLVALNRPFAFLLALPFIIAVAAFAAEFVRQRRARQPRSFLPSKATRRSGSAPFWAATSSTLFIVGVASSITPISITWWEVAPALVLGLAAVALTYPPPSGKIERWRGIILLGVYSAYLLAVLQST
jgi:hypothetical protein